MLETKYVSSQGTEFVFGVDNNRINNSTIRDYEWQYATQYNKIRKFYKDLETRSIPVFFFNRITGKKNEMLTSAEELYAIAEYDVKIEKQGRLFVGDYFINCYIIGSTKSKYDNGVIIAEEIIIVSDFRWWKIVSKSYGYYEGETPETSELLDYQYDYKYDYTTVGGTDTRRIASEAVAPWDFRITFQGPVSNPKLIVGGYTYEVLCEVGHGEKLVVDSLEKKVVLVDTDDSETSMFNYRNRDWYIFQKMPNDVAEVVWQDGHVVEIMGYIERSEPRWI